MWTQREGPSYDQGGELSREHGHADALILDFLAAKVVRNKFMVFIPPDMWYVVIAVQMD